MVNIFNMSDLKVIVQCLSNNLAPYLIHTLEPMAGETLAILYVHPLFFKDFFSLISKAFINIHEYGYFIFCISKH